ncbi:MAG: hypothetical protein KKH80_01010 [Candidatus Omnitrophica bacterium]|nr:hypothetical protein [Candidatus Omnitrophota bacterium]
MKSKNLVIVLVFVLSFASSGCVPLPLIVGSAAALGGYAVSKDTIEGETDKDYDALWTAAKTVAKIRGTIEVEDEAQGYLELIVDSSHVNIKLSRITKTANRLKVSARRLGLPKIALAQDIFMKILEQAS